MEQTELSNQDLILALIKADMRNNKLLLGLDNMGILAEYYFTDLGKTVMILIGFQKEERDDELYRIYDQFMDRLVEIELSEFNEFLNQLALELYTEILSEKKVREEMKNDTV